MKKVHKILILVLLLSISVSLCNAVSAATTVAPSSTASIVSISKGFTVSLKHVDIVSNETGANLVFTLTYNNNTSKSVTLSDYWPKAKSRSGTTFTTKVSSDDKSFDKLSALTSHDITYYSKVSTTTKITDISIDIVKWDFGATSYERRLGTIVIPQGYTNLTAAFQPKNITFNNAAIKTAIKGITANKDASYYNINIPFLLENITNYSVNISNMKFFIVNGRGATYDVVSDDLKNLTIQAKERKIVTLKSAIPITAFTSKMKLVASQSVEADKIDIPRGAYVLPQAKTVSTDVVQYRDYEIKLVGIKRLPWEFQDTVTAEFRLKNKGAVSTTVPSIKSDVYVNGVKLSDNTSTVIFPEKSLDILPQSETQMYVNFKLPYTMKADDIKISLFETNNDQKTAIGELSTKDVNKFTSNTSNVIQSNIVGNRSELRVINSIIQNVNNKKMFYADVELTNTELRPNASSQYIGYLYDASGEYYRVNVSQYKKAISAGGKALISVWGNVPLNFNPVQWKLILGNAVTGQKLSAGEDIPDGGVNYGLININPKEASALQTLEHIPYSAYDLTIKKIRSYLAAEGTGVNGIKLEFSYDLIKDLKIEGASEDLGLLLEIKNNDDIAYSFTKELKVDNADTPNSLKEGQGNTKSIVFEDTDVIYKINKYNDFKLNVYIKSGDQKILIASKAIKWFVENP
ncbi:hypothetical protein [Cohnella soli]|uniref:Uncharacterized protein n=1 Tax=Cohnella soli TaxID=425005 RepID=A0ABW0HQV3_9BACL